MLHKLSDCEGVCGTALAFEKSIRALLEVLVGSECDSSSIVRQLEVLKLAGKLVVDGVGDDVLL